nr:unnamed protein product [Spirometra erinaceieuropaei]
MLNRMEHRGACACDEETGDGAGVMTGIPYELYERFAVAANVTLPPLGEFAVGIFFVPDKDKLEEVMQNFERYANLCECRVLFWRLADVNNAHIGPVAASAEPLVVQVFVVSSEKNEDFKDTRFKCKIFFLRKYATHKFEVDDSAYICSLSPDTVVYKGMFTSRQLWDYYCDLQSPDFKTHFAIVHNRFSTNTFPSWSRAHPQRMMAHNGEINTLRGNVNYARARQALMESKRFGARLKELFPIIEEGMSDSGSFDNLLEFLYFTSTRSLPETVISMIPEAWHADETMPKHKYYFYKWAASLLEPWDGPALIVFSDGRYIGAVLDRNGLRPARYYSTTDGMVYMSSEVGVVDLPQIVGVKAKGRLKPGRLLIVDTQAGDLLNDEQLKLEIASRYPIYDWVKEGAVDMQQLSQCFPATQSEIDALCVQTAGLTLDAALIDDRRLALFGFTPENISMLLLPMLTTQKEALGSMGNDAPLACLSNFDPLVYEYFKQLFAQVTNPPIDPFRERIVMSLACPIGPEANVLEPSPHQAHRLWLQQPILSLSDMVVFRKMAEPGRETAEVSDGADSVRVSRVYSWRVRVLEASFSICPGDTMESLGERLKSALDELCTAAERAILDGVSLLVLTDRNIGSNLVPIPSLLALGAVHQHLLRKELRMKCGLIVESGDAREVHHFCTLLSFGADAICPYMVFEIIRRLCREGLLTQTGTDGLKPTEDSFFGGYVTAVERGVLKVMAKMGISTLHSYKAAQIFEAVGLASEVIQTCFTGTQSRVGGATFDVLAHEVCSRHRRAFGSLTRATPCANGDVLLNNVSDAGDKNPHTDIITRDPGFYHWRQGGEMHMNDPVSIAKLQAAARTNSREAYAQFAAASDENARFCTLRGQLDFIYPRQSIAIDYAISMRFNEAGLPKTRRIEVNLRGHAGQSFCAFLAPGVYVYLAGDANDYVGKGLSGGQVTIVPPPRVLTKDFLSEEHIIVGNACLYGAIEGRAFIRGQAAERFCVRNSGAIVVAEGCGDHGCEYMTGGRVVLLGRCGRNFAAGMSGGLAFVYDGDNVFRGRCNMELVSLTNMSPEHEYAGWLRSILTDFFNETGSQLAHDMLRRWDTELGKFICVFPNDYKRALEKMKSETEKSANEVAQDENAKPAETNNGPLRAVADIEDAVNGAAGDTAIPLAEKPDKLRGFVKYPRTKIKYRPTEERLSDWSEVYAHASLRKTLKVQTARCMDCGVPFCQSSFGCPLGNLIPTWNDLVFKDEWEAAHYAMMKTNNFPEFTGRVCPAPCEGACVLGIIEQPVAIKNVECAIGEVGWERGLNVPRPVGENLRTGKRIAIIGSGPSGLACAAQLIKVGHEVVVMERRNLPGGLLRYGIPTMKLDRKVLDRRLELMTADGVQFMCSVQVGKSSMDPNCHCRPDGQNPTVLPPDRLLQDFDATVLCLGSTWPRDLNVPGRHLNGIHFAMSFLERWQRKQHQTTPGTPSEQESGSNLGTLAKGKRVIVLGGGDTGVDCIATATRQGAISVQTLEIMPAPPSTRKHSTNPWPEWPIIWRSDYGHEEVTVRYGKDPRNFNILTKAFLATPDGQSVAGIKTVGVEWKKSPETGRMELVEVPGTDKILECDLVLLAMGFLGPEKTLLEELNLAADARSNIQTPSGQYSTSVPRIYAAGDCRRGQSLVVHAINEGRQAARQVDLDLMGHTLLPGPGGVVQPESSSPVKCCT